MGMLTSSLLEPVPNKGVAGQQFMENCEICKFLLPIYFWMKNTFPEVVHFVIDTVGRKMACPGAIGPRQLI